MTEEEIFHQALARNNAAERAAFLEQACADDPARRGSIEALLRANAGASGFLAPLPTGATIEMSSVSERPGVVIGPYKLLEQIGEGGFGVVFMAEQTRPVRRKVALKVLKPGMDTRQVVARFEAERQALAIMDHPHIAKVFDGGATPSGRPYFVMELVKGVPITEFCDQNHLTPRQRLELFIPVCQAVHHAHQKGIIHRDLKPSNVLVSRHDTTPIVKIIDFGVAKALGQDLTDKTLFTGLSQMIGTPLYMSPEQAGMSDLDVDTRSDIYSLGVLLYELLTGTTPFQKERFKTANCDEIRRIIREEEPPRPSTRLSDLERSRPSKETSFLPGPTQLNGPVSSLAAVSTLRQAESAKLTKLVRGDLDWIVMKCLEKDRNRRYETANGVTLDVQRYLKDEPVEACPPSAAYRFRKFARRRQRILLTAAVVAWVALLMAAASGVLIWRANQDLHQALDRERDTLDRERRGAYFQRIALAEREWASNNLNRMEELLGQCPEDLRGWEWRYLRRLLHGQSPLVLQHDTTVLSVAVHSDNRQIAAGTQDGFITLWDALTGQRLHAFRAHENHVRGLAFSPDSRRLASGSWDGTTKIWDVERLPGRAGAAEPTVIPVAALGVMFSPDGNLLGIAEAESGAGRAKPGKMRLWDVASGREFTSLGELEKGASSVAFSADRRYVAAGLGTGSQITKLWDAQTGQELRTFIGLRTAAKTVSLSPDGNLLAAGGWRGGQRTYKWVEVWDTRTGQERYSLVGHVNGIFDLVFSPDGRRLATAGFDETVKVWDAATGLEVLTLRGHQGMILGVAFSPDGYLAVSAGFDRTVRVWDGRPLRAGEPGQEYRTLVGHEEQQGIVGLAFHRDGQRLAARDADGRVKLWDWRTGKELHALSTTPDETGGGETGAGTGLALSPDGQWLAAAGTDFNAQDQTENRVGEPSRVVKLWSIEPNPALGFRRPEHTLRGHTRMILSVAFSPDGRYLVSSTSSGEPELIVWDAATLQPLHPRPLRGGHNWPIYGIALSGDGLLASAGIDGLVRIWDVQAGKELIDPPLKHEGAVWAVAFSPDGQRLASAGLDRVVKVWERVDAQTWNLHHTLRDPGAVLSVAFSPDGQHLAWGGTDSALKIWNLPAEPGGDVDADFHALRGHKSWVRNVAFSPDGQFVASGSQDGTVKIWQTPSSQPSPEPAADPGY